MVTKAKTPEPDEVFDIIRAVAREHALSQEAVRCICEHIQSVHRGNWGGCQGKDCICPRFRGIHWHKARMFERFGVALIARLRDEG